MESARPMLNLGCASRLQPLKAVTETGTRRLMPHICEKEQEKKRYANALMLQNTESLSKHLPCFFFSQADYS